MRATPMDYDITTEGDERRLVFRGRLTFADHEAFHALVVALTEGRPKRCAVDLSNLDFIDSAGLGMLIMAHDAALEQNIALTLHGAQGSVRKILDITKFDEIVAIEE